MVHVLAELQAPNCINHSIYAKIYSSSPCLVLNKINRLEFYDVEQDDLVLIDSLFVDEPVLALQALAHLALDSECLLLLTETYKLLVVWFDREKRRFTVMHSVSFDASDQQLPSDALPRIEVDPSPVPKFFLVYFFEGFIQAFIINSNWKLQEKRGKRKLDQHEFAENFTFSVGSIIVQDVRILRNANDANNTIVLYYRDYNFNISMRYYRLDSTNKRFNLVHQFEEFDEIPSAIINPLLGGSIVVSDNYMFYFPNPDIKYLELAETQDHNISIDPDRSVVTKRLVTTSSHDISAFNNYTIVDEKRIILINNRGETFILFFDTTKKSSTSIQVNSISFIKLGMTTVPISIHHIHDNLFYVASKLSQSVLFKILPQDPFIDIVRFIKSTAPILDIQANYNGHKLELLTCQGGYESGEFRRVSNRKDYLEYQTGIKAPAPGFLWEHSESVFCMRDPEKGVVLTYKINTDLSSEMLDSVSSRCILSRDSLVISEDGVLVGGISMNRNVIIGARTIESGAFMVLTASNIVYLYFPGQGLDLQLVQVDLSTTNEVSDMDFVQVFDTEFLVLLTFWDGSYRIYNVSHEEAVLLAQEILTPNDVPISSCCLLYTPTYDANGVWLLLTSSNSDLVQIYYNFRSNEKDANRNSVTRFEGLPYRFVKSKANDIIMFNRNKIYGISNDKLMNFNRIFPLEVEPNLKITDITFLGEDQLAVSATDEVGIYAIKEIDTTKEVIFSNDFNMKCLRLNQRSKHAVLLSSKNAFVDSLNEYTRNSFLQLVDLNKMKVISTYEFPEEDPVEMMDVCAVPVTEIWGPNCFVGVSNSSNPAEILRLFQIKKGKIVALEPIKLHGFSDTSELTMESIKLIDEEEVSFLVVGVMNYIVKPRTATDWYVVPEAIFPSPIFTNCSAHLGDLVVFGDVMKGINFLQLTLDNNGNKVFDAESLTPYVETNFLTDMVMFNSSEGNVTLTTDTFGNILGLKDSRDEGLVEVISYNIGDLINTITAINPPENSTDFHSTFDKLDHQEPMTDPKVVFGTVNGAIYSLSELNDLDEELESILLECHKELVLFKHTLSDLQSGNKKDKLERWALKKDRKFLQQDETGQFIRRDQRGVIDLIFIQYWLQRDAVLRRSDMRSEETEEELEEMERMLGKCYRNRGVLERLVSEMI